MGNIASNILNPPSAKKKSLEHVVNYIASKYIRQQNFKDMKQLADLEYCDKLIILTAKIIGEYLDDTSIKYLAVKKGIDGERMSRENVLALDKDDLDKYDVKNPTKKRRLCIGLAKHYVQAANLFAAIATTINPKYDYVDAEGASHTVGLEEKDEIPDDVNRKISRNNLCSNRVAALLHNHDISTLEKQFEEGSVTLNPNFCSFNCSTCPVVKDLAEEPGIPELESLYYDKYDYDTGKFIGMTPKMAVLYKTDVDNLYRTFTGNSAVPETIKKFGDIKLKDYYNTTDCEDGTYNQPVHGRSTNTNFFAYIQNVKSMIKQTKLYHDALLDILDKLFVFGINPETDDKTVVLNPHLTDAILADLTRQTIKIINDLYISCEAHFTAGVELYTQIAKKQFLITTQHQIESLKSTLDDISKTKLPEEQEVPPVPTEIADKPLITATAAPTTPTTPAPTTPAPAPTEPESVAPATPTPAPTEPESVAPATPTPAPTEPESVAPATPAPAPTTPAPAPTTPAPAPTTPAPAPTTPAAPIQSTVSNLELEEKTAATELKIAELEKQTASIEAETAALNATAAKLQMQNTGKLPTNIPVMATTPSTVTVTPTPNLKPDFGNISSLTPSK